MENRAYSFLTIKSFNEDERTIEGVASTPAPDRVGDVMQPLGARFKLPLPFLWQHDHSKPIGHVVEANVTPEGITFKAEIAKTDEPGKLKELLDFAWQSIKMRLVGAVSIGFKGSRYSFLDTGGIEFHEWDWHELSAVTVPCQADATISTVKSIDAGLRKAAGRPDLEIPERTQAAPGQKSRVVKLDAPACAKASPVVIKNIIRT